MLSWIDAHRRLTGEWPTAASTWVIDTAAEKWIDLDTAPGRRVTVARSPTRPAKHGAASPAPCTEAAVAWGASAVMGPPASWQLATAAISVS